MARQRKSIMDMARDAMATGPAPKEEVMDDYQFDLAITEDAAEHERKKAKKLRKKRRARFERAYMAALSGYCSRPYYDAPDGQRQELNPSRCARIDALETVRQWDEMMAELDGEEG